ncbi:MAG TPA: lactate utilization protein [Candidatus Paceibacterota bacterium]
MTTTFNTLASQVSIDTAVQALLKNGFQVEVVENKTEALERIKALIPKGASVHNGGSVTLQEIGYIDYLKANTHGWNNLHANILDEADPKKQDILRQETVFSDYYLGSVHALSETGEMVIGSNTGSQLPHLVFTSPNAILVVGAQKISPTLEGALRRLENHVVPLEDKRALGAYNAHTMNAKTLILHKENPMMGRSIKVILVKEELGF